MTDSQIYAIAARNGRDVPVKFEDINLCFDFHRETPGGVPFGFTAEIADGKTEYLFPESFLSLMPSSRTFAPKNG